MRGLNHTFAQHAEKGNIFLENTELGIILYFFVDLLNRVDLSSMSELIQGRGHICVIIVGKVLPVLLILKSTRDFIQENVRLNVKIVVKDLHKVVI